MGFYVGNHAYISNKEKENLVKGTIWDIWLIITPPFETSNSFKDNSDHLERKALDMDHFHPYLSTCTLHTLQVRAGRAHMISGGRDDNGGGVSLLFHQSSRVLVSRGYLIPNIVTSPCYKNRQQPLQDDSGAST